MTPLLRLAMLILGAGVLRAQEPPPIAKYVPAAPDPRHVFVMDSAHVLSEAAIRALQDSSAMLQAATGADIAWVTLPTLGGRSIEEAAVYVGRTWKVGSAGAPGDPLRNRGLVILYIPDKTKTAGSNFRVEVGKGLQGTIIDSRSRAISAAMREDLRAKHFDAGYMKGWAVAAAMVREDFAAQGQPVRATPAAAAAAVPVAPPEMHSTSKLLPAVVIVVFIGFMLFIIIGRMRRARAGPPVMIFPSPDVDDDEPRRRRPDSGSSWFSSSSSGGGDSGSSGDSGGGGGDFGGGGGFDGGGSSDSI